MRRRSAAGVLSALAVAVFALGVGCRCSRTLPPTSTPNVVPSVRLYLVSTGAGALEPCGCVKDMLGGVDHFAALVASEAPSSPHRLVLGAGPMLFADPVLDAKKKSQDEWKANALFGVLHDTGFAAWAPGANDFALGAGWLGNLEGSKDVLVAANLDGLAARPARVIVVGGERVGIAGITLPRAGSDVPAVLGVGDAAPALERASKWLGEQGAHVRIALLAMPRGEALRLAEKITGFQ